MQSLSSCAGVEVQAAMPTFAAAAGATNQDVLVARGAHDLLFDAREQGDNLAALVPVAQKLVSGLCRMGQGEFSSLLLDSVLRASEENDGGPGGTIRFSTHSFSEAALTRFWGTVLTVVNKLPASDNLYFWVRKERGEVVTSLRKLRAGLLTTVAKGEAVIEAARLAMLAGTAPPSMGVLAAARASVAEAKGHLASWDVMSGDFRFVYFGGAAQVGINDMPDWWRNATWARGSLADDDDGSYRAAASAELYTPGRLDHASGMMDGGSSRTFAKQVVSVARREALKNGDSDAAYDELPDVVLVHTQLQQLASAEWPEQLSHWCRTEEAKFMDAHALFIYSDHRGAGTVAEKELTSAVKRLRAVVKQLPNLSVVVDAPDGSGILLAALRRLVDAAKGEASSFVTLDHLLLVDKLLLNARALCSGPVYSAKTFGARVDVAVTVLIGRRGMLAVDSQLGGCSGSGSGDSFGSVTGPGHGSKTTGGYDAARLQHVKFSEDYVESKRQFLELWDSGRTDDAILILLRGSTGVGASGAAVRSPPLKVFHDLLFGTKDVYVIDQDLERQLKSAREHLPAFFGRRVAKSLGETLESEVPLTSLVASLSKMETWATKTPDFYMMAFVPVRVMMGDIESALHLDKAYVPGQSMFDNRLITDCCADMVASLLGDLGLAHTSCTAEDYATANISSLNDAFAMVRVFLQQFGSLTTARSRAGTLLGQLFGEFGSRQAATRQSVDPQRQLESTFVVLPSLALAAFQLERERQRGGRKTAADLAASGYYVSVVPPMLPPPPGYSVPPSMPPGLPPPLPFAAPDAAGEKKRKADFEREMNAAIAAGVKKALKSQETGKGDGKVKPSEKVAAPASLSVVDDGDVLLVTGGLRNPAGCRYKLRGDDGLDAAVEAAVPGCCTSYFAAVRGAFEPAELALLPCHAAHGSDGVKHPAPDTLKTGAAGVIKLADFRINADGTKHAKYKPDPSAGSGGGVPRRGAAKPQGRRRKPVGGPGRRKVAFSALASLGGAFGSSTTSTCSAALLLTLASGASTSQPWDLAPPGMLGAAAAGTACDRSSSAATGGWLPVGSRSSVASFDATFPSSAPGPSLSGGQARYIL